MEKTVDEFTRIVDEKLFILSELIALKKLCGLSIEEAMEIIWKIAPDQIHKIYTRFYEESEKKN